MYNLIFSTVTGVRPPRELRDASLRAVRRYPPCDLISVTAAGPSLIAA